ncbi:unnamed protein product [Rotaria sordida]|uniref:Uncharacterized protein n=1 Tax=Rotaria sordida TaxID=392033 RepID=A0A819WRV5_9BILA|nr:unnamed protein product [Rotaria sordida]
MIFLLATTTTTTTRCFDICWQENCETGANTSIPCPSTAFSTSSSTTTSSSSSTFLPPITSTSSPTINCQYLEDELRRVKLGLGIGLGSGMLVTTGLAIGTYIYFSRQLAQYSASSALGPEYLTRF